MMKDTDTKVPHRGHELLDVLARLGGSARNGQIAQVMDVSEETVRRLVKTLAKQGKVERVHGGTYLRGSQDAPMYSGALEQLPKEKTRIAKGVMSLIQDGMTIFVNVGSTTTYVAEQLRELKDLIVVTNSISVVAALADHNGSRVFLAGGEVSRAERGSFGRATEEFSKQFSYDALIIGADAVSPDLGVLANNPREAELTRALTGHARRVIVAADCRKFTATAPCIACPMDKVTDLVTDGDPPGPLVEALNQVGARTHVTSKSGRITTRTPLPDAAEQ
ncbi:DeoR/GlpR family DNA-binding transcription regulator [Ruegeria aquimaris]|uniref:DeoR/GlpR family DNA-binding transcription regulator n=1 Tax=Ruegeria aquimaris TaxID=2984333 RepID=A0ABT3AL21_9RHOB|nr:DeoR/GlpR family DNA-binding transcription regulator [Ruegeria sp. XHP0148]MCV2889333.1 DeoR/GlpR family DNA-binding transcription regulator [Ruegeria sp. XHP0148]